MPEYMAKGQCPHCTALGGKPSRAHIPVNGRNWAAASIRGGGEVPTSLPISHVWFLPTCFLSPLLLPSVDASRRKGDNYLGTVLTWISISQCGNGSAWVVYASSHKGPVAIPKLRYL